MPPFVGGSDSHVLVAKRNTWALARVWEAVQRAYGDTGQAPHIRSLAATAARIYDELAALAPNRRPARLKAAVAALKADAASGS